MLAGDDQTLLEQIDAAFLKHKVLMFRDAGLDRETHLRFLGALVRRWGLDVPKNDQMRALRGPHGLVINPFQPQVKGAPEVWATDTYQAGRGEKQGWSRLDEGVIEVTNDRGGGDLQLNGKKAASRYAQGNAAGAVNVWHSDQLYFSQPSAVTTLRAVRLPPCGGDTMFANMEQAYEDLDDDLKRRLDRLTTLNRQILLGDHERCAERTQDPVDRAYYEWLKGLFPENRFPVVRTHPVTGNKSLYVVRIYASTIEGPGVEEIGDVQAMIRKLSDLTKVPEYQCRFRWHKEGDLLMWDNRCLQHYAVADFGKEGGGPRWMEHVTTMGTTPLVGARG